MDIHNIYRAFQNYFRPRRKRKFMANFPEVTHGAPVLDVGGTTCWWEEDFPKDINVTIVNTDGRHQAEVESLGFKFSKADGRKLPFGDKEFYLTFSNSVIEHVGTLADQERFATEAARCGQKLYLQTPNKWFPIEPHLIALFIHWLPFKIARRLIRYFSIWGLVAKPSQATIDEFLLTTRLLTKKELARIFPHAHVIEEKFFGLTKSYILMIG